MNLKVSHKGKRYGELMSMGMGRSAEGLRALLDTVVGHPFSFAQLPLGKFLLHKGPV